MRSLLVIASYESPSGYEQDGMWECGESNFPRKPSQDTVCYQNMSSSMHNRKVQGVFCSKNPDYKWDLEKHRGLIRPETSDVHGQM